MILVKHAYDDSPRALQKLLKLTSQSCHGHIDTHKLQTLHMVNLPLAILYISCVLLREHSLYILLQNT